MLKSAFIATLMRFKGSSISYESIVISLSDAIISSIKSYAFTENAERSWVYSPVFIPEFN